jgi:hypothetical protein
MWAGQVRYPLSEWSFRGQKPNLVLGHPYHSALSSMMTSSGPGSAVLASGLTIWKSLTAGKGETPTGLTTQPPSPSALGEWSLLVPQPPCTHLGPDDTPQFNQGWASSPPPQGESQPTLGSRTLVSTVTQHMSSECP